MAARLSRRELLSALAALGLAAARRRGQEVVLPWADGAAAPPPGSRARFTDLSRLRSSIVANDEFFVLQHHGVPRIDRRAFRLLVRGGREPERTLSIERLRDLPRKEIEVCFECAGNGGVGMHGLVGNARWAGVPLREILSDGRVGAGAREVVFYGADEAEERLRDNRYPSRFARSLPVRDALEGGALLAYEMNGKPLSPEHGFPVRLIVPGWYGIAQVKWLTGIEVVEQRFMGWYMAKDYVTVRGHPRGGSVEHRVTSVGRQRLKSLVTRVVRGETGAPRHEIQGLVWNDGAPLEGVEISIDGGSFRPARVEPRGAPFAWAAFRLPWDDASPGRHRLVSRARDANGVQPTAAESSRYKATPWENDGQVVREIVIPALERI